MKWIWFEKLHFRASTRFTQNSREIGSSDVIERSSWNLVRSFPRMWKKKRLICSFNDCLYDFANSIWIFNGTNGECHLFSLSPSLIGCIICFSWTERKTFGENLWISLKTSSTFAVKESKFSRCNSWLSLYWLSRRKTSLVRFYWHWNNHRWRLKQRNKRNVFSGHLVDLWDGVGWAEENQGKLSPWLLLNQSIQTRSAVAGQVHDFDGFSSNSSSSEYKIFIKCPTFRFIQNHFQEQLQWTNKQK